MILFKYEYNTPLEIFSKTWFLSKLIMDDYIIILIIMISFLSFVYYIIPFFQILKMYRILEKKKSEKKDFLNQIVLQKDIEDEIERELGLS